jgi:cell pole-organizing protein PopZ
MEDLLASIRKAINEDIGPETASGQAGAAPAAARAHEAPATSTEIQQLREKITRSRNGAAAAPRDPAQRAASLAAALRSNTPRRAWRDIEPAVQAQAPQPPQPSPQPAPRFRSAIIEPEAPRPARPEQAARSATRFTPERQPSNWPHEDPAVAAPREAERAPKAEQSPILSGASAQAVQSAFNRLAETMLAKAIGEQSIEDMTRELLKAMLKQWLDDNLPEIVERLVREEIERVARTGR